MIARIAPAVRGAPAADFEQVYAERFLVAIASLALEAFAQRFDYGAGLALAREIGQGLDQAVGFGALDVKRHAESTMVEK